MSTKHLESDLERFFAKKVSAVGGMSIKLAPTRAGVPDRLVLLPWRGLFLVELKTETGPVRDIQKIFAERAAAVGVPVAVLRGRAGALRWLAETMDDRPKEDAR